MGRRSYGKPRIPRRAVRVNAAAVHDPLQALRCGEVGIELFRRRVAVQPLLELLQPGDVTEMDKALAAEALEHAVSEVTAGRWDMVVLDELNTACALDLVPVAGAIRLIDMKPQGVELVLTGRGAPEEVIEKADLVTEMKEIKHYFRQGVPAREGIEK